MGLDTVELILSVEEEFGVAIPDEEAEQIVTVGDLFDWLKPKVVAYEGSDNKVCLSQHLFYKLRQALVKNYKIPRDKIRPDTRLSNLISLEEVESGWPYVQLHSDFKVPAFQVANQFLGFRLGQDTLTMKDLVEAMIKLNGRDFVVMKDSEEEVWRRLVKIFVEEFRVPEVEIRKEAQIVQDLGLD